jgi:hypothetical protein
MTDNNRLPPRARAKIFALADQEAAVQTAMNSNLRQLSELAKAYDLVSDEQRKLELRDERSRRQQVQETQRERHRALADLNGKIRRFLDLLPADATLDDAKPVKIKLKPGESHQQLVADVRVRIVKLIGERSQVERAALPVDEIKAQVKKWITERAIQARPAIMATHEKFDVKFTYMDPEAFTPTLDPLALLAWLDPAYLEDRLNDLVDEMPKPKLAMTPSAKAERLAAIKVELGDAERLECALIDDALDKAILIDHRPNVDLRALLGIVVTRSRAKAA